MEADRGAQSVQGGPGGRRPADLGLFGEEWAVMFTDLSGFSRKAAEFGIIHFLQEVNAASQLGEDTAKAGEILVMEQRAKA